jgi:hypothetical protein
MADINEDDYVLDEYNGEIIGDYTSIHIPSHIRYHPPTENEQNGIIERIRSEKGPTQTQKEDDIKSRFTFGIQRILNE